MHYFKLFKDEFSFIGLPPGIYCLEASSFGVNFINILPSFFVQNCNMHMQIQLVFIFVWQNKIGEKEACEMLMKLAI